MRGDSVDFSNINENSIKNVFKTLLWHHPATRSEIAENNGISVMTAGKIIDAFAELGIINQRVSQTVRAGRRSREILPNKRFFTLIYYITSESMSVYVTDMTLKIIDSYSHVVRNVHTAEHELIGFYINSVKYLESKYRMSNCVGCGILVPGEYDISTGLANVSWNPEPLFCQVVSTYPDDFPGKVFSVSDVKSSVMRIVSNEFRPSEKILALYISNIVESCFFTAGDEDYSFNDCGFLPYFTGDSLNNYLKNSWDPEESSEVLSKLIFTVLSAVSADELVILGNKYDHMSTYGELIGRKTTVKCVFAGVKVPNIIYNTEKYNPIRGLSAELIETWFNKEILQNH